MEPEREIAAWLKSVSLRVIADGKDPNGVCFPHILVKTWKINPVAAQSAIICQKEINGIESLCGKCHGGLFWLFNNGVPVNENLDKLKRSGGKIAMIRSIRSAEIEADVTPNMRHHGLGLLRLLNHHRRGQKIRIKEDGMP
jgi:hypothetical protein